MRNAYIDAINQLAGENKNILALVADNGAIVFDKYRANYPNQFINFGIAEANMVAVAAGLASKGKIPFAYTIAGFITMRAYEQVRNDVCLQKQNVKLVGVGAGVVYSSLGATHHATEDISIMRVLPGMTIFNPASPIETRLATLSAAEINGPVYIRVGSTKEPEIYDENYKFEPFKGVTLKEGKDITLITTGAITFEVLKAAKELEQDGINVRVINMHTLKPVDEEIIIKAAEETKAIISVEEHNCIGGLASIVSETLIKLKNKDFIFDKMGLDDCFCKGYGCHADLRENLGISAEKIKERVRAVRG